MASSNKDIPKFEDTEPLFSETMPLSDDQKGAITNYLKKPTPSEGEALLGGSQQGLTLGHADELGGLMGAGNELLHGNATLGEEKYPLIPGSKDQTQSLTDLYKEYRDMQRKRFKEQESAQPVASTVGNLAGGLLGATALGLAAAPAAAPAEATTFAKRLRDAVKTGAVIGGLSGEGNSEAPLNSGQMVADIGQGATAGAITGGVLQPAVEGTAGAMNFAANTVKGAAKKIGEATLPDVPGAFMRGFGKNGQESREWLVGPKAAKETTERMYNTGGEIPLTIENKLNQLATQKNQIIDTAAEKGFKIDPAQVDEFIQRYAGEGPNHIDPKVNSELEDFQNLLKNAKDGNEVEKISRVFFGNGNAEHTEFAKLFAQKQAEEVAKAAPDVTAPQSEKEAFEKLFAQKQAEQQAIPGAMGAEPLELSYEPIEGNPDAVLGVIKQKVPGNESSSTYKKISSKLVDPSDEEEMQGVQNLLKQKQAEQNAIPGSSDSEPLELHMEPTDIEGKQLAVVRQKQNDVGTPDTYRRVATKVIQPDSVPTDLPKLEMILQPMPNQPGMSLGVIRKAVLDEKGNVAGYKVVASRPLNNKDALLFRDMAEVVRSGDRDLTDPRQLLDLYKTLKGRTFGKSSYTQQPAVEQANAARKDIQGILRENIPPVEGQGLEQVDNQISSLNQAKEAVGLPNMMNDQELHDPDVKKKIGNLIVKSTGGGIEGEAAQEKLQNLIANLKRVDPKYGGQVEQQIGDLTDRAKTTEAVQEKGYVRRWTATPRAWMNKTANVAGYGIGFMVPDQMRSVATKMAQGSNVAKDVSKVLLKAATQDDQGRNAIMFGLMQNPAYRNELKSYIPVEDENK